MIKFQVKNTTSGRIVKDGITGKRILFDSRAAAEKVAQDFTRHEFLQRKSFRSPCRYTVVEIEIAEEAVQS